MNSKILMGSHFVILTIGFALGYYCHKSLPEKIIQQYKIRTQENIDETKQIKDVQLSQADITSQKETIVTQKEFTPTGILKQEITSHIIYNQAKTTETHFSKLQEFHEIDSKLTKDSLITETQKIPEKNWTLNFLIPLSNYKEYSDYTLQVAYRIYGPVSVLIQENANLSHPMAGIGVQF